MPRCTAPLISQASSPDQPRRPTNYRLPVKSFDHNPLAPDDQSPHESPLHPVRIICVSTPVRLARYSAFPTSIFTESLPTSRPQALVPCGTGNRRHFPRPDHKTFGAHGHGNESPWTSFIKIICASAKVPTTQSPVRSDLQEAHDRELPYVSVPTLKRSYRNTCSITTRSTLIFSEQSSAIL